MVRRTFTIAVLGMLLATALAGPDSSALSSSGNSASASLPVAEAETPDPDTSEERPASVTWSGLLGETGDELLVGHSDVLRLYRAFFDRDPDPSGAEYWIDLYDTGATIDDIAFNFAESEEFRNTYGEVVDRQFVKIVYNNVLGRSPDPGGYDYWLDLLGEPSIDRVDVVRWVSASSEFIGQHPYRRPAVEEQIADSPTMAIAVDVIESVVGQRPTAGLPTDRSAGLVDSVSRLQNRFGRFSSVTPSGVCVRSDRTATCPVRVDEVGLAQELIVSVVGGLVVSIEEVESARMWADDAVRTAITGRTVFGSRTLHAHDRTWIQRGVRRIASTIGTVGRASVTAGDCEDTVIDGTEPGAEPIRRRGCNYSVEGPSLYVNLEAVSHNGVFAGIHVQVPHVYTETGFAPYATVGEGAGRLTLHHPANRAERIGYHESGHDGSRQQFTVPSDTAVMTMPSRNRGTQSRSAADITVHPDDEIRSPVTGTVLRAGTYTLYCDYTDHFLVIEPDVRPGYEVKVLHFEGLSVAKGDRVVAGSTKVGSKVRKFPFESQIDKYTGDPSHGHIHIEVVDPSIPDRPSGRSC